MILFVMSVSIDDCAKVAARIFYQDAFRSLIEFL